MPVSLALIGWCGGTAIVAVMSGKKARRTRARQSQRPPASQPKASQPKAARSGRGPSRPRPLSAGNTLLTPEASASRQSLERRSATSLLWLHQLPRWVPPALLAVLLITGLAVRGPVGALALAGVAVVLLWLAAISWPRVNAAGRVLRVLAIAVVLGAAVVHLLNRPL